MAFIIAAEGMFKMRFDLSGCGADSTNLHSQHSVDSIRRRARVFKDAGGDVAQVPMGRFVVVDQTDKEASPSRLSLLHATWHGRQM